MKSYNRSKMRRPESNFESDLALIKKLQKETQEQAKLAGEDFFSQLLGMEPANDNLYGEDADMVAKDKASQEKQIKNDNNKGRLIEKTIFEMSSQLLGEKSSIFFNSEQVKPEGARGFKTEAGTEFFRSVAESGKNLSNSESREISQKLKETIDEIKKLVGTVKELKAEYGNISVENMPVNPGKYYLNFFEWLFIVIKQARQKVEDSKTWLDAVAGKSKKMGYWGKSKKFGTSFSQANERNVATSTG